MPDKAPVEADIAVSICPDLGPDVYTNNKPLTAQTQERVPIFGGLMVAQAVSAASATVPDTYRLYSSQSSFLSTANALEKIRYQVERTFDGRTYATRVVHATQGEACIYIAYGTPMPDLDGARPEDIDLRAIDALQQNFFQRSVPIMQISAEGRPCDWRPLGMDVPEDPSEFWLRGFVRSPPLSTGSPAVHLAALAHMSDEFSFGPAMAANSGILGKGMRNISMAASLTHNVSFHDPHVKVDEWIVLERKTSWGAQGRVLVSQQMWSLETGKLVMSGNQEALIRLKGENL
ncbi:hypothetical protein E8E14_006687 [Neopestalotiopsis sp. 37M]|nr:hypothetical protein E8E14_006687 [Neopestalotiopsis sp. 37M]